MKIKDKKLLNTILTTLTEVQQDLNDAISLEDSELRTDVDFYARIDDVADDIRQLID